MRGACYTNRTFVDDDGRAARDAPAPRYRALLQHTAARPRPVCDQVILNINIFFENQIDVFIHAYLLFKISDLKVAILQMLRLRQYFVISVNYLIQFDISLNALIVIYFRSFSVLKF